MLLRAAKNLRKAIVEVAAGLMTISVDSGGGVCLLGFTDSVGTLRSGSGLFVYEERLETSFAGCIVYSNPFGCLVEDTREVNRESRCRRGKAVSAPLAPICVRHKTIRISVILDLATACNIITNGRPTTTAGPLRGSTEVPGRYEQPCTALRRHY